MAPKRAMKAAAAKAPAAKKPKVAKDTLGPKIAKVTDALTDDKFEIDTPMDVREMLASCGEIALKEAIEHRHEYQVRMVEIVEDTLKKLRATLENSLAEQKEFGANSENVKAQHEVDLAKTQEAIEAKKTEIAQRLDTKNSDADAYGKAIDVNMEAANAAEKADTAKERMTVEKDQALTIYNECFLPLKEDPNVDGNAKLLSRLEKHIESMDVVDESLTMAAPNALVKKDIAERGVFDNMALTSLDSIFKKFDADAQYTIDNSDALAAAAQKKKADTEAAMHAAEEKKKASNEAWQNAKKELQELQKTAKEHEKALKGHDKRVAEIETETKKAESDLEEFDMFVMDPFNFAKERTEVKPPEEEEPPAEEEAPAEEDAAPAEEAAPAEAEMPPAAEA